MITLYFAILDWVALLVHIKNRFRLPYKCGHGYFKFYPRLPYLCGMTIVEQLSGMSHALCDCCYRDRIQVIADEQREWAENLIDIVEESA